MTRLETVWNELATREPNSGGNTAALRVVSGNGECSALSSPEKKVTTTRFGVSWKCRLTEGFHGELEGGSWRAGHSGAVGELW